MLEEYLNRIINADCMEVLKKLPSNSIDLVVTSPPYNLKNSTGNGMKDGRGGKWANAALIDGYENYDDCMPNEEYARWQHEVLLELVRVIKDDGAIFYNHKWRVQAGLMQDRRDIVYDVPLRQIIIWKRKGGINFNAGYFLPTYEVIYLIAKKDFKLAPHANRHGDVWEIMQEQRNDHPAPFPVELIDRIISSTNGQIVLDPFMGSGTTAVVAAGLGRDFIGIEKSAKYCKAALERLEKNKVNPEVAKYHQPILFPDLEVAIPKTKKHNEDEYYFKSLF
ncbi:MAG: site-specific DNA-methyltransferase [Bacteroidaceae bacterium]|nr:site-specific DNA-methyltransferase [Bacteroidaceae bacterium]